MREPSSTFPPEHARADQLVGANDHLVKFYESDQHLSQAVTQFLGLGLSGKDRLLVIATEAHQRSFRQQLESMGFDVKQAIESGRITFLGAHETLSRLMRDKEPDARLFEVEVGRLVARQVESLPPGARLRAYGEMVDVLWASGQHDAALQLEELWNELQQRHSFTLLCAYAMAHFYKEPAELSRVCGAHAHVLSGHDLQTKEHAHRQEIESALRQSLRELRSKEQALRQSQQQLEVVTDALPTLVSFVDAERKYRFVSAAYERWFGGSKSDVIGKPVEEVLGPDAYQALKAHVDRVLSGTTVTFETELPYRDGARWVEATYIPQREPDGQITGFIGLVADISERKKLEAFRASSVERATRLLKITSAIANAVTDDEVFHAVVDQVGSALDASSVGLWLLGDQGKATLVRSVGYSEATVRNLVSLSVESDGPMPILEAIRSKQPVWISSQAELLERYPHLREVATEGRAYRVAALPIMAQGGLFGALGVTFETGREPRLDEREFLQLIAGYASQAIERLRSVDKERRSRELADATAARMAVLSQASRAFVETALDLQSRIEGIATTLGQMLSSAVGIQLLGADQRLTTSSMHHPDPEAHALLAKISDTHHIVMGEGISGATIASGKSTWLPSIEPAALMTRIAPPYQSFLERFPVYAMICVPLRAGGRIIGVVLAARVGKGETYTKEDLELVEQLADRSAAAIDNSRMYEESLQARLRSDQLYRFAQAVMNAATLEEVLDAALDAIEAALGTRRAAVLTYGGGEVMRFRRWRSLSDEYRAAVEGHSPWKPDALAPQAVLVADAMADPSLASYGPLFKREGIGALGFIPLFTAGRLLGKFMVYFEEPHQLSQHELEMIQAIANHLASVIARFEAAARLEETVRANELFAGVLAHDLRNPLGAMINAAQLLELRSEGQEDDDRQRKPLSRILSSGQRMRTMIEQLLDFTRARSGGGIELDPQDANVADLCAEAIGELELSHPKSKMHREVKGDQRGTWDSPGCCRSSRTWWRTRPNMERATATSRSSSTARPPTR